MACYDMEQNARVKITGLKEDIIKRYMAMLIKQHGAAVAAELRKKGVSEDVIAKVTGVAVAKATEGYQAMLERVRRYAAQGKIGTVDKIGIDASGGGGEDHVHVYRFAGTADFVPVAGCSVQRVVGNTTITGDITT